MLKFLGFNQSEDLINSVIPSKIRSKGVLPLGAYSDTKSATEVLGLLASIDNQNKVFKSFIGQGYYNTTLLQA